ncbi:MAG: hypothetical protein A3D24_02930 [Candidatus Blackburnbacteria bacterium RIFCSPHIGHO2_02_FULL_39_13]|uniref:Metallo-beta-lactamase domain-containing protein n=1 Tax=Candidatus Blackburnbacteria bacterium RIFCSPLOWO2_01_FULL_40_20 TaxID=1797519 RepID=A0A1G1VB22_9BACT|nr:MAG: Ribocuclease J [Microgenomates group bacterium GW2011_GWA2_39_19]OGY07435.1 MAG: hypothetical protein A2694_00235 [Candidatus Blackburnbacteria bacterium RIFCSPHIGHO2_01_FULL_40_17]OGY08437.1 MAG: hypothetical protein A3D24_02930 [Candidatus Blackburnbacteria bacterium RIFCSPHIGHO2_02_FULL_39_13]OGY12610.1 MAG: hypothetical protein A3A77_05020 [Candidatus Blackburnbacteria bacterium RIFCSPLOWO2_01_FULL_40_20]HBL52079.1 ribonuclease J [Candidatus Blackburnbacteria bacterium]
MDKLRFIAISGTTGVTENMYVYEYGNEAVVVDCGVGFPEEAAYGVDLVIPDFTYLVQNKNKIKAILISHGHEDHIGSLPFLFREMQVPIYATGLVAEFIKDKFSDYGQVPKINVFDPERDTLKIGNFTIDAFRVSHSVPDGVGFCIKVPQGKFFHVPDYKFDWTPVDQKPFDVAKVARLAADGVINVASDCLGSTSDGYTKSEYEIEKTIDSIFQTAQRRIFFTTISSNISRMQQAIRVSERLGRKVVFIGRSIEKKAEIAKKLGFINWSQGTVVAPRVAEKMPVDKVTYIISGSYGQIGSALYRVAMGEHTLLNIEPSDLVVFSADPAPPGTDESVNYVVDNLIEKGAEVHYYDTQEDLHVSGHGSQKDIEMLLALIRPKYMTPIGGTIRHMKAFSKLVGRMGWRPEDVFELRAGESVEFDNKIAKKGNKVPSRSVLVDGLGVGDVGNVVLRDRQTLAKEGVVVAILELDKNQGRIVEKPDLVSRGFVFAKEHQDLLDQASLELTRKLAKHDRVNVQSSKETTVVFLEQYFFEQTGRRPMILPVVVEV